MTSAVRENWVLAEPSETAWQLLSPHWDVWQQFSARGEVWEASGCLDAARPQPRDPHWEALGSHRTAHLSRHRAGLGCTSSVAFRLGCATQSHRLRRPSATVSKSHLPGLVSTRQGSKQRSCKCPVGIQLIFLRTTVQQLERLKNEETLSTGRICAACWGILLQGPSETNQTWDFHHVKGCNIYSLTLFLFFIKPFVFWPFLLRPRKKPVLPPSPCPARPAEQDPTALWINTYLEPLGAFTHTAIHRSAEPTRAFLR